jgi:uncharacterized protein
MRSQALAHDIGLDHVDLELLDRFLRSDGQPPCTMTVSELDGFLAGIAGGPEWILPSEWLPLVWGGEEPAFADVDEGKAILRSLLGRYNEILRTVFDSAIAPILWTDRDGGFVATDWAKGFAQAINLRQEAWLPLLASERDCVLLLPIVTLSREASMLLGPDPRCLQSRRWSSSRVTSSGSPHTGALRDCPLRSSMMNRA